MAGPSRPFCIRHSLFRTESLWWAEAAANRMGLLITYLQADRALVTEAPPPGGGSRRSTMMTDLPVRSTEVALPQRSLANTSKHDRVKSAPSDTKVEQSHNAL